MADPLSTVCDKCGHEMLLAPSSELTLHDVKTVQLICPNCLHVRDVEVIVVQMERCK